MSSTPLLLRRSRGIWLPVGQSWGPTGRPARWTPPYSTPATVTGLSTLSALQSALNAASAGDVLEITADLTGSPVLTGGNAAWATNVLVRPPIGVRLGTDSFSNNAKHVTVGGLDYSTGLLVRNTTLDGSGARSGFMRCVATDASAAHFLTGVTDGFLHECVSAKRSFNESGDRLDAYSLTGSDEVRATVNGCVMAGYIRGVDPTLAQFEVNGPFTVGQVLGSYTHVGANTTFDSCLAALPNIDAASSITVDIRKNGTIVATQIAPTPAAARTINDWDYATFATVNVTAGDVITATVNAKTGTPPRVQLYIGNLSAGHVDTMQFAKGPAGNNDSYCVRNSIIQASSNAALQSETNAIGDVYIVNNWFDALNSSVAMKAMDPATRTHFYRNYFIGGLKIYSANLGLFMDNLMPGVTWLDSSIAIDPSNTVDINMTKYYPGVPDLSVVWPECPYVGNPS